MASSAKTLLLERPNATDGWTIVLPRRWKQRRSLPKIKTPEEQQEEQPWVPTDLESDPERELKLMQKIQTCIQKLENSQFWRTFLDQIQTTDMFDCFFKALSVEAKFQMVIYGIGSIESYDPPRLQLSLAILMKREFTWIGNIEVFDPVISLTESRVIEALGCSVLSVNEQSRRQALRPTLFFMPHCEAVLYDNLLQANWSKDLLSRIVLFGNSFEEYDQHGAMCKNSVVTDSRKHILAARRFTKEYEINTLSDDFYRAFIGSSWHFFCFEHSTELQVIS